MILTLALWLIVGIPATMLGLRLLSFIDPAACIDRPGDRCLLAAWLGLLALSILLLGLSLIGALTAAKFAGLAVGAVAASLAHRETRLEARSILKSMRSSALRLPVAILVVALALYATREASYYDTALYHYQYMKWLSEYGLVPGLGLIHFRFGFITSWFAIPAVFEDTVMAGRTTAILGGMVLLLVSLQWLIAFDRYLARRDRAADRFTLFGVGVLLFYFQQHYHLTISSSPDVPLLALPVIVAWSYWLTGGARLSQLPFCLAVGAFTIKLSALPLLLVATAGFGYELIFAPSEPRQRLWIIAGACTGVLAILVAASVLATGCALYPVAATCVTTPWSIEPEAANAVARAIKEWAHWGGPTPADAPAFGWIKGWIEKYTTVVAMLVAFFAAALVLRRRILQTREASIGFILASLGIIYVFLTAPNGRFLVGYLCILPGLFFAVYPRQAATGADLLSTRSKNGDPCNPLVLERRSARNRPRSFT